MRTLAIKLGGPFRASSRADGTILVHATGLPEGTLGVFARLELAEEIEDRLNALHKKLASRKKGGKRARPA